MELFLARLHHIAWKRGDGNGRIRMSCLADRKGLKKVGEPLVIPPEAKGNMSEVLLTYGNEQFEVEIDENNDKWV